MAKPNTPQSIDLKNRLLIFFQQYRLETGAGPLLVAVSGGADSVCLFHILRELQDKLGVKLHVVHLDHRLRGQESAEDARFVGEIARRYRIPATIEAREVQEYRSRHRLSLEEAAREVRYRFFAETARSLKAAAVAVGHNADDNIETILMHLIRGTGTRGLRGLSPITRWHPAREKLIIIRPLLEVSRREIEQYCQEHSYETRNDKSNASMEYLRNRVRRELRPLLESYNPQINDALLKLATIAGDELAFLDDQVQQRWNSTVKKQRDTILLDKKQLLSQPRAIQRHLLRRTLEELLGELKDIETRHIDDMIQLLEKPAGRKISLPYGLFFSTEYGRYLLGPDPETLCPFPALEEETALHIPGTTFFSGWHITARITSVRVPKASQFLKRTKTTIHKRMGIPRAGFSAYLDFDLSDDSLKVRKAKPGDRFQPFGMAEEKKVSRFMIDAHIPHSWRQRIPIVVSSGKVAWVTGYRIDDRFKVTEKTRKILKLHFRLQ